MAQSLELNLSVRSALYASSVLSASCDHAVPHWLLATGYDDSAALANLGALNGREAEAIVWEPSGGDKPRRWL